MRDYPVIEYIQTFTIKVYLLECIMVTKPTKSSEEFEMTVGGEALTV